MYQINFSKLAKAMDKAKRERCTVTRIGLGEFEVLTPKLNRYVVRFEKTSPGRVLTSCTCKAGQYDAHCYHVAAVVNWNTETRAIKRPTYVEPVFSRPEPPSKGRIEGIEI